MNILVFYTFLQLFWAWRRLLKIIIGSQKFQFSLLYALKSLLLMRKSSLNFAWLSIFFVFKSWFLSFHEWPNSKIIVWMPFEVNSVYLFQKALCSFTCELFSMTFFDFRNLFCKEKVFYWKKGLPCFSTKTLNDWVKCT